MARVKKEHATKVVMKQGGDAAGWIYFLGIIGAAVYYIQQAEGFFAIIWAVIKAFLWPGFVVYDLLQLISV